MATDDDDDLIAKYVRGLTIPKKPRPGYVLAHNHVRHEKRSVNGANGFRAWWIPRANLRKWDHFAPCSCGWGAKAGKHYALREHVRWWSPDGKLLSKPRRLKPEQAHP